MVDICLIRWRDSEVDNTDADGDYIQTDRDSDRENYVLCVPGKYTGRQTFSVENALIKRIYSKRGGLVKVSQHLRYRSRTELISLLQLLLEELKTETHTSRLETEKRLNY